MREPDPPRCADYPAPERSVGERPQSTRKRFQRSECLEAAVATQRAGTGHGGPPALRDLVEDIGRRLDEEHAERGGAAQQRVYEELIPPPDVVPRLQ